MNIQRIIRALININFTGKFKYITRYQLIIVPKSFVSLDYFITDYLFIFPKYLRLRK